MRPKSRLAIGLSRWDAWSRTQRPARGGLETLADAALQVSQRWAGAYPDSSPGFRKCLAWFLTGQARLCHDASKEVRDASDWCP